MAEPRDTVDLRTLEEVHRLLAASDFATEGDRGSGPDRPLETSSSSPLPRRR